jgi:hypothetical protein
MARESCEFCEECKIFRPKPGGPYDCCICRHRKSSHANVLFGTMGGSPYFGAIAFSPSTGRYACSFKELSQESADKRALKSCNTRDAAIVAGGFRTYLALARADDGSMGWGATTSHATRAAEIAFENCNGPNRQVVLVIDSANGQIGR